jgi:hypothetical protein
MRIKFAATLALGLMLTAAACGSDEPENESTETTDAAEEAAEDRGPEKTDGDEGGDAGGVGACADGAVADAVAEIVEAAGVQLTEDDSEGDHLSCVWESGQEAGPSVHLTVTPSVTDIVTEELLESLGQTPIQDERFASVDATLVEILGCGAGHAGDVMGCALGVYGAYDVTLQVLLAEEVTVDQMVEVTWAITEQVY